MADPPLRALALRHPEIYAIGLGVLLAIGLTAGGLNAAVAGGAGLIVATLVYIILTVTRSRRGAGLRD